VGLFLLTGCFGGRALRHESWPNLTVVDDTIYAANLEHVQALNAETGKLYWSFPDENDNDSGPFYSKPVLASEFGDHGLLLIAGFKDQTVYALSLGESPAERPDELWTFTGAAGQYVGSGVVADNLFLIGNGDGKVYALDLANGKEPVWSFQTGDRVWATPVVIDDTVYIASLDHHLYAVDLATGAEKWQVTMNGSISATPVMVGEHIWVGDFAKTLYQIDLQSHEIVWSLELDNWLWATPVVDEANAVLYFADVSGYVYALDTQTHEMLWDEPAFVDDIVHSRPVLNASGNLLYVAGYEKGGIHAINAETGAQMNWGEVQENPGRLPGDLVLEDGRLYSMPILVQERIQAWDFESGAILWSYPSQDAK
jgi:outer membrane protein assembly factor BamB